MIEKKSTAFLFSFSTFEYSQNIGTIDVLTRDRDGGWVTEDNEKDRECEWSEFVMNDTTGPVHSY